MYKLFLKIPKNPTQRLITLIATGTQSALLLILVNTKILFILFVFTFYLITYNSRAKLDESVAFLGVASSRKNTQFICLILQQTSCHR